MDADGGNQLNLTNHPDDDEDPAWLNAILSVAPAGKTLMIWGRLKQVNLITAIIEQTVFG